MNQDLCETSFTGQKLESLLLGALSKGTNGHPVTVNGLKLISVDAEPMSIQGYISKVLKIRLTWNHGGQASAISAPETVIVKCPTSVNLQRMLDQAFKTADGTGPVPDASLQIREIHNDEILIYEFLNTGRKEVDLIGIPIPRFFGATFIEEGRPCSDGVLIMEDMSKCGKPMQTLGSTLNLSQIENMAEALANLHAWSHIVFSGEGDHDHVPSIQDRLDRWQQLFCSTSPEMLTELEQEYPNIFSNMPKEKMLDMFSVDSFLNRFGLHAHDDKLPIVLVHGDIQPMNILFSNDENDGNRLVGLIDWQLSHKGYGTEDLARLLSICSKNGVKREHGDNVLRRYVQAFNARIKDTGLKPITFENVKSVFTQMYAYMAMLFATSARVIDNFVEAVPDETEKERMKNEYIENCGELYQDAIETLGW